MLTVPKPFKKDIIESFSKFDKDIKYCNNLNKKYVQCLNDYIIGGNTQLKCNKIYLEFKSKCINNKD